MDSDRKRIAIVGAGAAGLMAAIQAARSGARRIVLLDGADRPGAKILVSGGGRCNLTNRRVAASDFSGSTPAAVRKVLRGFDVTRTLEFFASIGVEVREEERGKLFPVSDRSRTVLDALLGALRGAGLEIAASRRVESIRRTAEGFELAGSWGRLEAERVVLATGGKSLPKSGSDGSGFRLAESLGHGLTPRIRPALVPLLLPGGHPLRALSGISSPVRLDLRSAGGKRLHTCDGDLLCTHFGISGPAVLDVSRHYQERHDRDPGVVLTVDWLPGRESDRVDGELRVLGRRTVKG